MDIITLITTIIGVFSSYGSIGLVAAAGWGLFIYTIWKQGKNKKEWTDIIAQKDEAIKKKDTENLNSKDRLAEILIDLQEQRIKDLKESSDEITDLCNKTIITLDRIALALNVHEHVKEEISNI